MELNAFTQGERKAVARFGNINAFSYRRNKISIVIGLYKTLIDVEQHLSCACRNNVVGVEGVVKILCYADTEVTAHDRLADVCSLGVAALGGGIGFCLGLALLAAGAGAQCSSEHKNRQNKCECSLGEFHSFALLKIIYNISLIKNPSAPSFVIISRVAVGILKKYLQLL